MFKGQVAVGMIAATGAAMNIQLGFKPAYVKVINQTDAGTFEWLNTMPEASALKQTDAPALSVITVNGISVFEGSDTPGSEENAGFTIGADADMNGANDVLHYLAVGAE